MTDAKEIRIVKYPLPATVHGASAPTAGGFIVLLNANDTEERQREALRHEIRHIENGDHGRGPGENITELEAIRHAPDNPNSNNIE